MAIHKKIQDIINQRAKHLPKIRAMKAHLQKMLEKLDKLDTLVAVVNGEIAQQKGDYYAMIVQNPKIADMNIYRLTIAKRRWSR